MSPRMHETTSIVISGDDDDEDDDDDDDDDDDELSGRSHVEAERVDSSIDRSARFWNTNALYDDQNDDRGDEDEEDEDEDADEDMFLNTTIVSTSDGSL